MLNSKRGAGWKQFFISVPMTEATSGTARLAAAFARAKTQGRGALIPYLCAGDPDRATSAGLLAALGPAGADIIELGIPYGDPLADGPTIAAAAQRALTGGTRMAEALAIAGEVGYPVLLRPSYVLGGRAMEIVYDDDAVRRAACHRRRHDPR